jgi:cyanate permease
MMLCVLAIALTILAGFRRRTSQQPLMMFALAALVLFGVHGTMDYALEEPSLAAYLAAILGLGYGVAVRA